MNDKDRIDELHGTDPRRALVAAVCHAFWLEPDSADEGITRLERVGYRVVRIEEVSV